MKLQRFSALAGLMLVAGGMIAASAQEGTGARDWSDADVTLITGAAPLAVPSSSQARIVAGTEHNCALTSTGAVKCWGANFYGEIGDGTTTNRLSAVAVTGLTRGVVALAAGRDHSCAVTGGGAVKCWGRNTDGQLGDGTVVDRRVPTAVRGLSSGVVSIAAGRKHTCALTSAGAVKCWGANPSGELGDGTTTTRLAPVAVRGLASGVVAITAGFFHTCAVTSAGALRCWGSNERGQLGDGTTTNRLTSVGARGLQSGVMAIDAGYYHSCAVISAGAVRCWGFNVYGQLGNGTTNDSLTRVSVRGLSSGVATLAGGAGHTCALTASGAVKCWGWNGQGQIGDGTTINRLTQVAVRGLSSGVAAIVSGAAHTCALIGAQSVKCWGKNASGQLGDGSVVDRHTPGFVDGF